MSKLEENQGPVEVDEARLEDVSGGPIYMHVDGVKGSVTSGQISGVQVGLADGSVKFIA